MPRRQHALQDLRRLLLRLALDAARHDFAQAAHALGLTPQALKREIRQLGIELKPLPSGRGQKAFEVPDSSGGLAHGTIPHPQAMELFERTYLRHALRLHNNRTEAGRALGLSRTTLYRHLNRLRILVATQPRSRTRKR